MIATIEREKDVYSPYATRAYIQQYRILYQFNNQQSTNYIIQFQSYLQLTMLLTANSRPYVDSWDRISHWTELELNWAEPHLTCLLEFTVYVLWCFMMFYEIISGIFPEKYLYFSGNFQKNSEGNFRKFPNSHPYLSLSFLFELAALTARVCCCPCVGQAIAPNAGECTKCISKYHKHIHNFRCSVLDSFHFIVLLHYSGCTCG